jgi:hypothetical protein
MDSIQTVVADPKNPGEPVMIRTVADVNETIDTLINRHNANVLELRILLNQ